MSNINNTESPTSLTQTGVDDSIDKHIEEMNKKHAVLFHSGRTLVINEEHDPSKGHIKTSYSTFEDIKKRYSNTRVVTTSDDGSSKKLPLGHYWLSHPDRKQYDGIVFMPTTHCPDNYYNLWRGFKYEPEQGDKHYSYLDHIKVNVSQGNETIYNYLLDWMADAVQNIEQKPGVCVCVRGLPGTGKSLFINAFMELYGQHGLPVSDPRHITGNFNAHLQDCLLLNAEEAFWGGSRTGSGILKTLISETERVIEQKGKDPIKVNSYTRLMASTNDSWAFPVEVDDRRYFIIDCGSSKRKNRDYFGNMMKDLEDGGYENLLYELLHRDISQVDITDFPMTQAIIENKKYSMNSIQKFWIDYLKDCDLNPSSWKTTIPVDEIFLFYQAYCCQTPHCKEKSKEEFGKELRKLVSMEKKRARQGLQGKQIQQYVFPELSSCIIELQKTMGEEPTGTFQDIKEDPDITELSMMHAKFDPELAYLDTIPDIDSCSNHNNQMNPSDSDDIF